LEKLSLSKKNKKSSIPVKKIRRVFVENVFAVLKRFKVIAERYHNRRKRFNLRFNLIAGIYNFEAIA